MRRKVRSAVSFFVAAAFALAGCAALDTVNPRRQANSSNPHSASSHVEQPLALAGGSIVGTLMIPDGAGSDSPRGVVINPVTDAAELLRAGLIVARYHLNWPSLPKSPDTEAATPQANEPRGESQSVGVWLLASPNAKVIGRAYFELVWAEGSAARSLVEHLAGLDFVAADRIGMAGISTNGFKVYSALLSGVPLRAGVIVGACADYHAFLRDSPLALDGADRLDLEPSYGNWLREHEPIRHADRLVGTALLLVNGGRDRIIPSE